MAAEGKQRQSIEKGGAGTKLGGERMRTKRKAVKIILYVLLTCLAVIMLVPFYWMVISSLKLNKDVFSIPMKWWPETLHP